MALQQPSETITPTAQQIAAALDDLHLAVNFHKPYFNTKEAAAYVGRTVAAFYQFERRERLVRRGDGTISRKALDKIKAREWTAKRGPKPRALRASHPQAGSR